MKKKELVLLYMQRLASVVDDKYFTTQELVEHLNMQRTNLSTILNQLVKDNRVEKIDGRPVLYKLGYFNQTDEIYDSIFQRMIGYNGSLKNAIKKVKSDLMHPNKKHMFLLMGSSGVGKSFFVQTLFQYLKESNVVSNQAILFKLNCKYFINRENDLIDIVQNIEVQKQVRDGIIFLDNIHLLSKDKRFLIYDLITLQSREGNFILFFSSDKNVDKDFRENYLDYINVIIDIPDLMDRSLEERFEIINDTLKEESNEIERNFIIDSDVLLCLLLYRCTRNTKQLINDVKTGCASAYLREKKYNTEEVHVYLEDFPKYVKKGLIFYKENASELNFISFGYTYRFSKNTIEKIKNDLLLENHLVAYSYLEDKNSDEQTLRNSKINMLLSKYTKQIQSQNIDETSLSNIVDVKIIELIKDFLERASYELNRVFPDLVFYGLCFHIQSLMEHPTNKNYDYSPTEESSNENHKEYVLSLQLIHTIEEQIGIHIALEEVPFIAMFISEKSLGSRDEKFPVFLIALHGDQTASSLVEVVKTLVKTDKVYAYNLPLDKEVTNEYSELKNFIKEIDIGKGILMMYDMGSLKTMAKEIAEETGIHIEYIVSPTTLIALECARKLNVYSDLNELHDSVESSYMNFFPSLISNYKRQTRKNIIITLCITGQGGALQIKKYLESELDLKDCDIYPLSMSDEKYLKNQVNELLKEHNIICIIGPRNPRLYGIRFINVSKVFNIPTEKLPLLFTDNEKYISNKKKIKYSLIFNQIQEQIPDIEIDTLKQFIIDFLNELSDFYKIHDDKKIGIIMHLINNIDSLIKGRVIKEIQQTNKIINKNKKMYTIIKEKLFPIEKEFDIEFSDSNIVSLIMMIKEI